MSSINHTFRKSGIMVLITLIAGVTFLLPVSFIVPTQIAHAAINPEINYQAKLEDSAGSAVADTSYSVVFRLYTVASGGTHIWTETNSVDTVDGLFSVMLGNTSSLSGVDFNQTLYLGINVAADGEMTPRKVLGSVPSAFEADNLDGEDGAYYLDADNLTDFGNPFYTFFSATNTDALSEGSTNKYWTQTLFDNALSATTSVDSITTLTNLTTVGTIGTGVWNGTSLSDAYVDNDITIDSSTVVTAPNFVADDAAATSTLPNIDATQILISGDYIRDFAGTNLSVTNGVLNAAGGSVDIGDNLASGTAGSALFLDGSGNLAQDNANFFWDDSNNRLGIGTNNPGGTLDVS